MLKKFIQNDNLPELETELVAAVQRMSDPTVPGNNPLGGVFIDLSKDGSTFIGFYPKQLAEKEQPESVVLTWMYHHTNKNGEDIYGHITPISRKKLGTVIRQLFKDCSKGISVARDDSMVEVCFPRTLKDLVKKAGTVCEK